MIQRIQSIFLALAALCEFSLFKLPFATTAEPVQGSALFAGDTVYNINDQIILLILFVLTGLAALGAIFLYNNRKQQALVTRIAAVVSIVAILLVVIFFWRDYEVLESTARLDDGSGLYTTVAGSILLILANRYINKDEKLVRSSYDRLR